ncbi:5'-methylthioadenosine/adenosylhomocysteine nucleosidase [Shewanella sp. GXUN23E]|uniref:5'-methylthioadenosine/adenosylhomocysteine nucleosidase n=1 Tax=Shewanella sp. GXUN23E TaxID=3422498 RepID=UPI003D7E88AB
MNKLLILMTGLISLLGFGAQAKPIALLGAMDVEIEGLLPKMQGLQTHKLAANTYYTGTINGKSVVVARSGVGKVNAAVTTHTLISRFEVDKIIFTGIAGAASSTLNVADVVVSDDLIQHDVDLTVFGSPKGLLDGYDNRAFRSDEALQQLAIAAARKVVGDKRVHTGTVVTGDQFIADKAVVAGLQQEFNAMAVEMEGAAVAQVADMYQVPVVVIRTISDKADGSAHLSYEEAKSATAHNSVAIVLEMLQSL